VKSVKNIDSEVLLFFGRDTIFSNFHLSTFTDGKRSFNCVEQYFQYSKAGICVCARGQHRPPDTNQQPYCFSVTFSDEKTAAKIMAVSDPRVQKIFGTQLNSFRGDVWDSISTDFMQKGLELKVFKRIFLL